MAENKWLRIMELAFGLVNEIDEALNEVDAEPIDTLVEDDHGHPNDWEEIPDTDIQLLDVCLVCGVCTSDLKFHLSQNIECRQALDMV